jgi:hypothetical protein
MVIMLYCMQHVSHQEPGRNSYSKYRNLNHLLSASMVTRRPNLVRWSSYMGDCIQALEKPDIAVKSDLYLCQWVRAQRIAEEIGQQFFMDDPSANLDVSDLSVQYILRGYEQQICQWKTQLSPDILRRMYMIPKPNQKIQH